MKRMIVLIVLVGVVFAHSGKLYSAAAAVKVGIKDFELEDAQQLAKDTGYERLYRLLGGKDDFIYVTKTLTEDDVEKIFWPVLVWAIEEGDVNVTQELLFKFIGINDKKPYGNWRVTPREIAEHHKKQDILNLINRITPH